MKPSEGEASVTVCVVNRDGGADLQRLLDALPESVPVVVVDNASRDGSQRAALRRSFTVLLENPVNAGFAKGCNQAARRASTEFLLFLNNDAVLELPALRALEQAFAEYPGAVAAGPRLLGGDGVDQQGAAGPAPRLGALLHRMRWVRWTGVFRAAHRRYRHGLPQEAASVERLGGAALATRRDVFLELGGFDEGYPFGLEDVDLCLRLGARGSLRYVPEAVVTHAGGVSSAKHQNFAYRGFELGFARYARLRLGRIAGWVYKLAVTVDHPLRATGLATRWALAFARGRSERRKRLEAHLTAVLSFLPSLPKLWLA